ncbi:MAG: hypothetical protein Q3M30_04125 [Candidatus Electrothrix sp. Rat3]|nr:hypothetical protein [Candidatus Electrothrix rattekaaiensis]
MIIISAFIALNGLLYQPKKDPNDSVNWSNINFFGRVLFCLLVLLALLNIIKIYGDEKTHQDDLLSHNKQKEKLLKSQEDLRNNNKKLIANQIELKGQNKRLSESQNELKDENKHLIKVMSVANGYNAVISGVVSFEKEKSDSDLRDALRNLLLKYVEINISASNKFGDYKGKVNYGTQPVVRRFLSIAGLKLNELLRTDRRTTTKILEYHNCLGSSYYFELRVSNLKILNSDKIQYAEFGPQNSIKASAYIFDSHKDFQRIYNVNCIVIGEIEIEEIGTLPINEQMFFF